MLGRAMKSCHKRIARRNQALLIAILLLILPSSLFSDVSVQGSLTHELELLPGSTHAGVIVLYNSGPETQEVKLYQTDYRSQSPGQNYYEEPGTNPRSNSSWVTFSSQRLTVPAGESFSVPYVLEVPLDPSLSGTYWSVLMVEPIPPESPESVTSDPNQVTFGIRTVFRYALRFITHIGTSGTSLLEFVGVGMSLSEGVPSLDLDVGNVGTRSLKIEIWAELYDGDGKLVARCEGPRATVFPASVRQFRIPLEDVARGAYTALVVMDAGGNHVFGANFPLVLE